MPISDFIRSFLQNVQYLGTGVGWTPEQQAAMKLAKERQAAGTQQQANWEKQFALQQKQEQDRAQQEAVSNYFRAIAAGFQPAQPHPSSPQAPEQSGGPSFMGGGGETGGAGQHNPASLPGLPSIGQMLGQVASEGQQGQGGQGVNTPGQIPSGISMTPSDRIPTANAASGGGAAVQAARSPIVPTPFNIPGLPSGMNGQLEFNPQYKPDPETVPYTFTGQEGPGFAMLKGMTRNLPPAGAAEMGRLVQAAQKPPKEETAEDRQERTAAINVAAKHPDKYKDPSKLARITDLKPEDQAEGWAQKYYDTNPDAKLQHEVLLQQKRESIANMAMHMSEYKELHGQDTVDKMVSQMQSSPDAFHAIKFPPEVATKIAKAFQDKTTLPVPKQLKPDVEKAEDASNVVSNIVDTMRSIRQQLGPDKFGAIVGRLENFEGKVGDQIINQPKFGSPTFAQDTADGQLEQRFRYAATTLAAQEAKLLGGGRANLMLYNDIRNVSPNLRLSPNFLEGSFKGIEDRVNSTRDAAVKARFGGEVRRAPDGSIWKKNTEGKWIGPLPVKVN